MSFDTIDLLSYSILFAALIGLVRFKQIDQAYWPFIILIWVGCANELVSTVVTRNGYSNAINTNFYYLIDAVLLLVFFRKNGLFNRHNNAFYGLLYSFVFIWTIELFVFKSINEFSSYFIGLSAFSLVIMSIHMINKLIGIQDGGATFRKSLFVICIGLILFYTYAVVIEIFWVYGLNSSKEFRLQVYRILAYINLAVNLMYAVALLWIPRKRESLLL